MAWSIFSDFFTIIFRAHTHTNSYLRRCDINFNSFRIILYSKTLALIGFLVSISAFFLIFSVVAVFAMQWILAKWEMLYKCSSAHHHQITLHGEQNERNQIKCCRGINLKLHLNVSHQIRWNVFCVLELSAENQSVCREKERDREEDGRE